MVIGIIRALVRGVGWLLTPAIVAVTSAGALWLAASLGTGIASANLALATAIGAALGAGTAVFVWWVLSLRRARQHARRRSLRVNLAGPPAVDAPAATPAAPPVLDPGSVGLPSSVHEAAD